MIHFNEVAIAFTMESTTLPIDVGSARNSDVDSVAFTVCGSSILGWGSRDVSDGWIDLKVLLPKSAFPLHEHLPFQYCLTYTPTTLNQMMLVDL